MTEEPETEKAAAKRASQLFWQCRFLCILALAVLVFDLAIIATLPVEMKRLGQIVFAVSFDLLLGAFALLSLIRGLQYAFVVRRALLYKPQIWLVLALGLFLLLVSATVLRETVSMARRTPDMPRPNCQNNLKQHGLVCKMFAYDNRGVFPPLSPEPGKLSYAAGEVCGQQGVYGEYLSDTTIMVCPSDEDHKTLPVSRTDGDPPRYMDDWSYFYLGYAVTSDAEMRTFSEAYGDRMARGEPLCDDIPVAAGTGSFGADTLSRLGENLFPPQEPGQEENPIFGTIPVIIERRGNHPDNAVNVLWMDGHVTLLKPGTWPNTDETMAALAAMDALSPPAK